MNDDVLYSDVKTLQLIAHENTPNEIHLLHISSLCSTASDAMIQSQTLRFFLLFYNLANTNICQKFFQYI